MINSLTDRVIKELDVALRTLLPPAQRSSARPVPGQGLPASSLSKAERKHIAGLMRVNHSGEVCAQALYQGQALTAKLEHVREKMIAAAAEEVEHLAWCEQRLRELGSRPSVSNPLWYLGSFTLGALAGLAGDRFSLGFVAETERQVSLHLQKHLQSLPPQDLKTKAVLERMLEDESHHAETALMAGGLPLPEIIRQGMQKSSKLMTETTYYF